MLQDLTVDKSTLVQVLAWCRQATSHYLSQCWPRYMLPNGVTRPQWFKSTLMLLKAIYSLWIGQVQQCGCWCPGVTRSITWLLMLWRLVLPGHQQPWYWLLKIAESLSCMRQNFYCMHHFNVTMWQKMQIYSSFFKKFSMSWAGISLFMRPANEKRRYNVTTSLIGWAHT